jgi:hypothetical protein
MFKVKDLVDHQVMRLSDNNILKPLFKQSNNPQSFDGGMEIVLSNFKEINENLGSF